MRRTHRRPVCAAAALAASALLLLAATGAAAQPREMPGRGGGGSCGAVGQRCCPKCQPDVPLSACDQWACNNGAQVRLHPAEQAAPPGGTSIACPDPQAAPGAWLPGVPAAAVGNHRRLSPWHATPAGDTLPAAAAALPAPPSSALQTLPCAQCFMFANANGVPPDGGCPAASRSAAAMHTPTSRQSQRPQPSSPGRSAGRCSAAPLQRCTAAALQGSAGQRVPPPLRFHCPESLHAPLPAPLAPTPGGEGFPMVCLASPKTCGQEGQACCYNSDPASETIHLGRRRCMGR
jgi:hypothetical protein